MSSHSTSVRIERPAEDVLDFMADPENLSLWSFGTWNVEIDETGLVKGTSIGDGSVAYVRIAANRKHGLIDYLVGVDRDKILPRIFARVSPGPVLGGHPGECALTMVALRTDAMDDERWATLGITHDFEVRLIKSALESGHDHRANRA